MTRKPLAIDLYAGLGGWSEGLLAEGFEVIGFDIERHVYGELRYPGLLVIQDVLTLHGSQFKDAALIVASPPCQKFSYMAMPWSIAKEKAAAIRADKSGKALAELTALFDACFRIQREASEAAGRHIPMVVENVRGAQDWVGSAQGNFGSFYLWGDVPVPQPGLFGQEPRQRLPLGTAFKASKVPGFRFDGSGGSFQSASVEHTGRKAPGHIARRQAVAEGRKGAGAGAEWFDGNLCKLPSASPRRKAASAMIAKIPFQLSTYIASVFAPQKPTRAEPVASPKSCKATASL